jgi:uncharacterized membrane protein YgcG
VLKPDVTDMVREFSRSELRRLENLCARLGRRFPQVRFAIIACAPPATVTLELYAFWLFNRGGLASAVERGGANRVVLLMLQPEAQQAVAMIGYGLEPFVPQPMLGTALDAALPHLRDDQPARAAEAYLQAFATQLEQVATGARRVFGLNPATFEGLRDLDAPADVAALSW